MSVHVEASIGTSQ